MERGKLIGFLTASPAIQTGEIRGCQLCLRVAFCKYCHRTMNAGQAHRANVAVIFSRDPYTGFLSPESLREVLLNLGWGSPLFLGRIIQRQVITSHSGERMRSARSRFEFFIAEFCKLLLRHGSTLTTHEVAPGRETWFS